MWKQCCPFPMNQVIEEALQCQQSAATEEKRCSHTCVTICIVVTRFELEVKGCTC